VKFIIFLVPVPEYKVKKKAVGLKPAARNNQGYIY